MTVRILCPHCRKPLGREGVEKDAVCPHCGNPLSSPPEHGRGNADPGKTSAVLSARYNRLARIARFLRRYWLLLWVGIMLVAAVLSGLDWQLSGPLLIGISAGLIITCVWLMPRGKRFQRLALCSSLVAGLLFLVLFALAIVSPFLLRYSEPCPQTDALDYCRNISWGIGLFHKDTGTWPIYTSADHSPESRVDFLYGNMGEMPEFSVVARKSWGSRSEDMYFTLVTNGRNGPWYPYGRNIPHNPLGSDRIPTDGWAEPYLPYVTDDPWAYKYLISVSGFEGGTKPNNHVWCLSAGPNGVVDTPAWATATRGDDVGYRTQ